MLDPVLGETYHSRFGASREARELYIDASGLVAHFEQTHVLSQTTHVLDVGLGLAYNAMETIRAWRAAHQPGDLFLASLENSSVIVNNVISGHAPWTSNWDPQLKDILSSFLRISSCQWVCTTKHPLADASLTWEIFLGDAQIEPLPYTSVKQWDYIWQDPFSPRNNPDMWDGPWFKKLFQASHKQTVLMTYSVARTVREALEEGGWQWSKIKTPSPMKKNWLQASPKGFVDATSL
jgi:tRNA U34 5-methylaminomethyl-2-thiouridine-forming methyltransferase MnmC